MRLINVKTLKLEEFLDDKIPRRASVCYAYLSDIPGDDDPRKDGSKFRTSRWFGRKWTLQELLAPENLQFYISEWRYLGA
ncbi:hypothetical protein QQZ08_000934 [Neonectria magnoliae]|uniref:Uncharacterized protein n=1 Tax=Neonectria magnoliae TaxID=2732573 RepID=A0ABR1IFF8_9HYPO